MPKICTWKIVVTSLPGFWIFGEKKCDLKNQETKIFIYIYKYEATAKWDLLVLISDFVSFYPLHFRICTQLFTCTWNSSLPLFFLPSSVCPDQCKLACTDDGQCCHSQCLGGCSEPNSDRACSVCLHYFHNERCVPDCPPGTYKFEGWRCITFEMCSQAHLPSDTHFVIHGGECMPDCPSDFTRNKTNP